MAISDELKVLLPPGTEIKKELTPHCFVNQLGQVVFFRQMDGERTPVTCQTVTDAVHQCLHIVEGNLGSLVGLVNEAPQLFNSGELEQMRTYTQEVQSVISLLLGPRPEVQGVSQALRKIEIIREGLGRVRNRHKVAAQFGLGTLPALTDERGRQSPKAAVSLSEVQTSLLRRYDELHEITAGTLVQAKRLVTEAKESEAAIARFLKKLGELASQVGHYDEVLRQDYVKTEFRPDWSALVAHLENERSRVSVLLWLVIKAFENQGVLTYEVFNEVVKRLGRPRGLQTNHEMLQDTNGFLNGLGLGQLTHFGGPLSFELFFGRVEAVVGLYRLGLQSANILAGLKTVVVEPYRSRIESSEVQCLARLISYLRVNKLSTYLRAFTRARDKLVPALWDREAQQIGKVIRQVVHQAEEA